MKPPRSSIHFWGTALRLGMAIAVVIAMILPHFSTTTSVVHFSMTMDHMSAAHGDISPSPKHHDTTTGALCATICLGADRFASLDMPKRAFGTSAVFWMGTSGPSWAHFSPDPALRPPDLAFTA